MKSDGLDFKKKLGYFSTKNFEGNIAHTGTALESVYFSLELFSKSRKYQ